MKTPSGFQRATRLGDRRGVRLRWVSQSGRVAVVRVVTPYQEETWYVKQLHELAGGRSWQFISHHRRRNSAIRAARRLEQRLGKAR